MRLRSRKGQGLSLNAIIIAVLALVVLVVLIVVFTGKIGDFQVQLGGQAKTELRGIKAFYGDCHPVSGDEGTFLAEYDRAVRDQSLSQQAKEQAKAAASDTLKGKATYCGDFVEQAECPLDCSWR